MKRYIVEQRIDGQWVPKNYSVRVRPDQPPPGKTAEQHDDDRALAYATSIFRAREVRVKLHPRHEKKDVKESP